MTMPSSRPEYSGERGLDYTAMPHLPRPNDDIKSLFEKIFYQVRDRLETRNVRVLNLTTLDTAEVIPMEDELCIWAQDDCDDAGRSFIGPTRPVSAGFAAVPFSPGRSVNVESCELQLRTTPAGVLADSGSVFVSIYSATNADFTPAASRTLEGVIGSIQNHQLSDDKWSLLYFRTETPIALTAGAHYFLVISADDPSGVNPDPWDGSTNDVHVEFRYKLRPAGPNYFYYGFDDFPDAVSAYAGTGLCDLWFRLYEQTYSLEEVPLADPDNAPDVGNIAVMRRREGVHGDNELIAGRAGESSSIRTTSGGSGSSSGSGNYLYLPGRSGGQLGYGGTEAGDDLTLASTAHATKGNIYFGVAATCTYDEVNGRFGVGTAAPSYPLHVVGNGYFSTQIGVGVAPSTSYAVYGLHNPDTNADHVGVYGQGYSAYTGGNYTLTVYGVLGDARATVASANLTNANYGLVGFMGRALINADNVTVGRGVGVLGQGRTTNGTARVFTEYAAFQVSTFIGTGGSIGTLYGVYMPTCTGTTRWGVYIADTGAKSYFAEQVQVQAGSAADLSVCSLASTTDGIYFPASALGVVIGGTEQWRFTATELYPIADNAEALGTNALGITAAYLSDANTTAPSAEGEVRMVKNAGGAYANSLQSYEGGAIHYNGPNLFSGPVAADTYTGATKAETVFATSYTVPANWWAAGKGLEILAGVSAVVGAAAGSSVRIRARIGGVAGTLLGEVSVGGSTMAQRYAQVIFQLVLVPRARNATASVALGSLTYSAYTDSAPPQNPTPSLLQRLLGVPNVFTLNTTAAQTIVLTYDVTTANPGIEVTTDVDYLVVRSTL